MIVRPSYLEAVVASCLGSSTAAAALSSGSGAGAGGLAFCLTAKVSSAEMISSVAGIRKVIRMVWVMLLWKALSAALAHLVAEARQVVRHRDPELGCG